MQEFFSSIKVALHDKMFLCFHETYQKRVLEMFLNSQKQCFYTICLLIHALFQMRDPVQDPSIQIRLYYSTLPRYLYHHILPHNSFFSFNPTPPCPIWQYFAYDEKIFDTQSPCPFKETYLVQIHVNPIYFPTWATPQKGSLQVLKLLKYFERSCNHREQIKRHELQYRFGKEDFSKK